MTGQHHYRISVIPAPAVIDPRLEDGDVRLLGLLGRHTDEHGWCRRSQVKMAGELNCSRGKVQFSLARLEQCGYIEVRAEGRGSIGPDPDKQPFAAHSYRVLLDREIVAPPPAVEPCETRKDEPENRGGASPLAPPGVPAYVGTGCQPTLARGANPGLAPLEESSVNYLSEPGEREARAREPAESEALAAFRKEFRRRWPTAALDDQAAIDSASAELLTTERQEALDGIEPFLAALKKAKRTTVISGATYLRERRWTLLPEAEAPEAKNATFKRWSREWWAVLLTKAGRGDGIASMMDAAISNPSAMWSERVELMPDAAAVGALRAYPSNGETVDRWRAWFTARDAALPAGRDGFWMFLSGEWPPGVDPPAEVERVEVDEIGNSER